LERDHILAKRALDTVASAVGLILLALPLSLIALAVLLDSGPPVLFRQTRIGLNGKPFTMLKFRTMIADAESTGRLSVGADPRVTRTGRILRQYKLDELPQLVNVLKGDMSLVGPRPEVPEFAFVYPEQAEVWSVRPGITDPTAVQFYNESTLLAKAENPTTYYREVLLREKTRRYVDYVRGRTFCSDVRIIFQTLLRMLRESETQDGV